ncbi:ribosome biogenesis GTPase Der [Patescibacteria group bacterium]|nr:ribosome biogenesis GTPase Der [Patescibacteria group bacterium]MBU4511874.1 ribosome biogenesis GTPase Der [Patescibacteria group bacterium]
MINNKPKAAIIGRTNVGKSTLFNRLTESGKAIVSSIPGTTRDRNYGECFWRGKKFQLADTGGLENIPTPSLKRLSKTPSQVEGRPQATLKDPKPGRGEASSDSSIKRQIVSQTLKEIDAADLIIFLIDANDGVLPQEKEFVKFLRKKQKEYLVVANKVDNKRISNKIDPEIYKLSPNEPFFVSAINGVGTGDLLDAIVKNLPPAKKSNQTLRQSSKSATTEQLNDRTMVKIAIIGKPNVGKSSLLNAIFGEEHVIVSETPHTTREAQDILINYQNTPILLIDTAGIRRKAKIDNQLEKMGVKQSIGTFKRVNLILFVIDAASPVSKQDKNLGRLIVNAGRPVLVIVNKWDLVKDQETKEYEKFFKAEFPHLNFAPLFFVSAKTGKHVDKILNHALETKKQAEKQIPDNALAKFLKKIVLDLKKYQGKQKKMPRLLGLKQTKTNPPTFEIIYSEAKGQKLAASVIKYIENRLREKFGFKGVSIIIDSRSIKLK